MQDGENCSICLDAWTSNGKHRICALNCGHLFGQSCIERWLKERRSCPRCGAKVGPKKSNRVIPLFVQNLVAKDTGELEAARKLLEEEKRLRKQCEAERVRLSIHNASLKDQLSRLGQERSHPNPNPKGSSNAAVGLSQGGGKKTSWGRQTPLREIEQPKPNSQTTRQILFSPSDSGGLLAVDGCGGFDTQAPGTPSEGASGSGISLSCYQTPSERHLPALAAGNRTGAGAAAAAGAASAYSQHEPSPFRRRHGGWDVELQSPAGIVGGGGGGDGGVGGGRRSEGFERVAAVNMNVGVRTEQLLSRDVQGGRVAAFAGREAGALLVSQEFGGGGGSGGAVRHGITKFSLADFRHHKNIYLHREQVRDVKFTSNGGSIGYVLSTSFDKTLKVCDLRTDSVVVTYALDGNGWSCQWSATNPTQMFCGLVDGTRTAAVQLFDLRSTAGAVGRLHAAASQRQPVHSICHTATDLLLCATMGGVWGWGGGNKGGAIGFGGESQDGWRGNQYMAERLQIQAGACCSLSQNNSNTAEFLVSTRGSSASHAVFGLEGEVPQFASSAQAAEAAAADGGGGEDSATAGNTEDTAGNTKGTIFGEEQGATGSAVLQRGPGGGGVHQNDGELAGGDGSGAGASTAGRGPPAVLPGRRRSWAEMWTRFPRVAQGHQSQHTLSRSLLWSPFPGADLVIAGGDERTNQPWLWSSSTGEVCHRLAPHRSPVLDVAALQDSPCSSRTGLFAAVSQSEIKVYETFAP